MSSKAPHLADTNVVFRRVIITDPFHAVVRGAVDSLRTAGGIIYSCPQNIVEFHALATRPIEANGLGMPSAEARMQSRAMESIFPVLPDVPEIFPVWCDLVDRYGATGRQVFDVRLVAVMLVHRVSHLLTLNPSHFRKFMEISVIEPAHITVLPG